MIGRNDVLEVCNTVALHGDTEVVVVGSADKGSILPSSASVKEYPMAGFAMALDRIKLGEITAAPLVTTNPAISIEYPIDVVGDADDLYVVSLTSTDPGFSLEYKEIQINPDSKFSPNWINMQKYGKSVHMTVTKLSLSQQVIDGVPIGDVNFRQEWSREFPVEPDGDGTGTVPSIYMGGAIVMKKLGVIAVAGSTRGMGNAYGAAIGTDEDGFITLIDMETGELSKDVFPNNIRIGTAKDDIVLGICVDSKGDEESFYIVGATKGEMAPPANFGEPFPEGSYQAFARKVNSKDLSPIWTVQLGAVHYSRPGTGATVAKAFNCVASEHHVYIGGVVDDGASMGLKRPLNSRGGDDIWVAQVDAESGKINWVRQEGSHGDDHMAPRGGLALSTNGNVVAFGDTNGSLFRRRSHGDMNSELFVMDFDGYGRHTTNLDHQTLIANDNGDASVIAIPLPPPTPPPVASPVTQPPSNEATAATATVPQKRDNAVGIIIGSLMAVALALGVLGYVLVSNMGLCRRYKAAALSNPDDGFKVEVKDGLVTDASGNGNGSGSGNHNPHGGAPPASSFDILGSSSGSFEDSSVNLKDEAQLNQVV